MWAIVKGEVEHRTALTDQHCILFSIMCKMFSIHFSQGCIKKVNKHLNTLHEYLEEVAGDEYMEAEAK